MAVPKKKVSPSRRGMRRSHEALPTQAHAECPNCGELKRPHHVCSHCGHYDGREVVAADAAEGRGPRLSRRAPAGVETQIVSERFLPGDRRHGRRQRAAMVLDGLELAAERHPQARFLLVGDEARLGALLARRAARRQACTIRHAPDVIGNDMKPTAALRQGRHAPCASRSMRSPRGEASGVVSAGNTGALLALAKIVIKTLPASTGRRWPRSGPRRVATWCMLDLGANVQCDARNLVEFAVMGDVFARTVLGLTAPTIGLLNVGSEELKGDDTLRPAAEIAARQPYRRRSSTASSRATTSPPAPSTWW